VKKLILYLDTSVFGGFFDDEFKHESVLLFERANNKEYDIMYSDLVQSELQNAPDKVKDLVKGIPKGSMMYIETTQEAFELANQYVEEGVVGKTSFADCLHIAMASIHNANILVSWNYKHIVNVQRITGYNSVNLKAGYKSLDIRSPKEIVHYED